VGNFDIWAMTADGSADGARQRPDGGDVPGVVAGRGYNLMLVMPD
jgi:hypothetical protein